MAVTQKQLDDIRDLHGEGFGRNEIARRLNIAPATVSRSCEAMGLSFDRTRIQAATTARLADLAERRTLLAEKFHDIAEESLNKIHEPTTVYAFGGKENTFEQHTFAEAPHAERRTLVMAAGAAADRSLKLAPTEETSGLDDAKSMLGNLGAALAAISRTEDEHDAQPEGEEA